MPFRRPYISGKKRKKKKILNKNLLQICLHFTPISFHFISISRRYSLSNTFSLYFLSLSRSFSVVSIRARLSTPPFAVPLSLSISVNGDERHLLPIFVAIFPLSSSCCVPGLVLLRSVNAFFGLFRSRSVGF